MSVDRCVIFDQLHELRVAIGTVLDEARRADRTACNLRAFEPIGLPREVARGLIATMRAQGLVEHVRGLWTEYGQPAGAGYVLTPAGEIWINAQRAEVTDVG